MPMSLAFILRGAGVKWARDFLRGWVKAAGGTPTLPAMIPCPSASVCAPFDQTHADLAPDAAETAPALLAGYFLAGSANTT